ncbi:helix-turn-helix transcriptional regulator [Lactobacillus delbrueckii subsp. lactis]|nr:helix-turn-helix transcriptional regulator [Lactobacillus delbrueckii subsp. lactis]
MSSAIGVPMSTYANYEYGRREPDMETIKKLAKLYNVTVDYLVGNDDAEGKKQTVDLAKDPEVLLYNGRKVSAEDMEVIKAILERHKD